MMMTGTDPLPRPRRSVLYLPANNGRALEKAKTLASDSLILDLEDSVVPAEKAAARNLAARALAAGAFGRRELVIRINDLSGPWGADDLAMAAQAAPQAVLVPKIARADDISAARQALAAAGGPSHLAIWAMVETPLCLLNLHSIGEAAGRQGLTCFIIGTNDLIKETRVSPGSGRASLLPWLTQSVLVGRAFGIDVIDGVYNDFTDKTGFIAECEQGRALGMDGKTLIHPNQIAPCNDIFSPAAADLERARKIIASFALPENENKGVITVDGRMTERLHLAMAERLVAIAKAIGDE